MKLNDFKLMYTRSEDRLLLVMDAHEHGTLRFWLTRNFTREWLRGIERLRQPCFLQGLPMAPVAPRPSSNSAGNAGTEPVAKGDGHDHAAFDAHRETITRKVVWGHELSDLAVAVAARFEVSQAHISSIIAFTNDSEVTLSLSEEVWEEVARIIHKADLIANWGLGSEAPPPVQANDNARYPASPYETLLQTKRLH